MWTYVHYYLKRRTKLHGKLLRKPSQTSELFENIDKGIFAPLPTKGAQHYVTDLPFEIDTL